MTYDLIENKKGMIDHYGYKKEVVEMLLKSHRYNMVSS